MGCLICFIVGMISGAGLLIVVTGLLLEAKPKDPPTKDEWKLM